MSCSIKDQKVKLQKFKLSLKMKFIFLLITVTTVLEKGKGCSESPTSTSCLGPNDLRDIPFEDLGNGPSVMRFPSGSQVIVTSYEFVCCGNVTQWRTFVDPGGNEDKKYDIKFQVWRLPPSTDTLNEGCYEMVGENEFRDIILGPGGEVCEAVPPEEQITVQPGDVVGFYQTHNKGGNRGVQIHQGYLQERVWFQVNPQPTGDQQCRFPVGPQKVLQSFTEHAPILSVTIESFPCESTTAASLEETTSKGTPYYTTTETVAPILSTTVTNLPTEGQENVSSSFMIASSLNATLPTPRESSPTSDILTTKTRIPSGADRNYFIASIVTGSTAAILLLLLVGTCILLNISVQKHRRRKKPKCSPDERLDICDSLMYNDVYIENKEHLQNSGLRSSTSSTSSSVHESIRYPPAPAVTVSSLGIGDSHYVNSLSRTGPPGYPPVPPTQHTSSTCHYMTTKKSIRQPRYDSLASIATESSSGDDSILVVPYAVTGSCRKQIQTEHEHEDVVRTTSNVAYNCLSQRNM